MQKEPWFLEINPNGRIPALEDRRPDGSIQRIFESGSIMLYLADRYDRDRRFSYERGTAEYTETVSWLFWQNAGLGPMQGQANHFRRYAPQEERDGYASHRYQAEAKRLYGVLDSRLARNGAPPFLVGEKATIADFAVISWVLFADWAGVDISEFPAVQAWEDTLCRIPGVIKGTEVPKKTLNLREMNAQHKAEYAANAAGWILKDGNRHEKSSA
jgi:glutathione S-transferase